MASSNEQSSTRTVLAEGEPTVRGALRALVTQGLDMQVVGEADTSEALIRQLQLQQPDLAIVAWDLVAGSASALTGLRAASPDLCIVIIGLRPEMRQVALDAGADGFISKVDAPDVVVRVLQGCREITDQINARGGLS